VSIRPASRRSLSAATTIREHCFSGNGSLKTSGRWHHKGTQVPYASEHPGVSVLEKLVWLDSYKRARESNYVLLFLELDPAEHLEPLNEVDLPNNWNTFPHPEATRHLGTQWFEEERSVVLAVPSAVLPVAKNYLINPFHPDFHDLERGEPVSFSWDARLLQRMQG
jgi:RES domain-containing protein